MKLKAALRIAGNAARANLIPGLLLQSLMIVFFALYVAHDGTRQFLATVANLKHESGYLFAFCSYVISAALLPEILRIAFFQGGRPVRRNAWNFLTAVPMWGLTGMLVDFFYRCQVFWFGPGSDWQTVLLKMAVDQFLFSPFIANPIVISYFIWRDARFRPKALAGIFRCGFFSERIFPIQVAGWCIWIPGVCLVYFMPSELQIPVASLIQSFWVLIFLLINRPAHPR
jgi:hypothetical protein